MVVDIHADIWTDVTVKRSLGEKDVIKRYHLDRFKRGNMVGGTFMYGLILPMMKGLRKGLRKVSSICLLKFGKIKIY